MHRRTFLTNVAVAVAVPHTLYAQTPVATPASLPVANDRPDPIDLGDGISLIDYRIHPGDPPGIIGELHNSSDHMIDVPVVSISWPRDGHTDGFSWLPPVIPVIEPGGSVPIYGPTPDGESADHILDEITFELCTSVEPGEFTTGQSTMTLELTVTEERIEDSLYNARGNIANPGPDILLDVVLLGIVRDGRQRIAGTTQELYYSGFGVSSRAFSIWAGSNLHNRTNPYRLITDSNYTVELYAGTRGPVTMQGCSFGFPWE